MRLIIVDDEMIIRNGLRSIDWKSIGITEVIEADNGETVLKILEKNDLDIVLMDIRMPGLSGLEVAKIINENEYCCEVILLTGFGMFEYAKEAIRYDVFEYLLKPSSTEEITNCVQRAIKRVQQKKQYRAKILIESERREIDDKYDNRATINKILEYIEKNYMKDITLKEVAEYVHFSAVYCSKFIKKETSYNFSYILSLIRMWKAAELITVTDEKIFLICEKVGIPDQRYFSKLFKRTFGKTPLEYRRESNAAETSTLIEFLQKTASVQGDMDEEYKTNV